MTKVVKEFAGGVHVRVELSSGIKKIVDDLKRDYYVKTGEKMLQEELLRQCIKLGAGLFRKENQL